VGLHLHAFFAYWRHAQIKHISADPPQVRLFEVGAIFRNVALTYAIFATLGHQKG